MILTIKDACAETWSGMRYLLHLDNGLSKFPNFFPGMVLLFVYRWKSSDFEYDCDRILYFHHFPLLSQYKITAYLPSFDIIIHYPLSVIYIYIYIMEIAIIKAEATTSTGLQHTHTRNPSTQPLPWQHVITAQGTD